MKVTKAARTIKVKAHELYPHTEDYNPKSERNLAIVKQFKTFIDEETTKNFEKYFAKTYAQIAFCTQDYWGFSAIIFKPIYDYAVLKEKTEIIDIFNSQYKKLTMLLDGSLNGKRIFKNYYRLDDDDDIHSCCL